MRRIIPQLEQYMDDLRGAGDSCGARIDVVAQNVPVGLGEPIYDKLDAEIAYAMMGINAVKGVEIGAGFRSVAQKGTEHGDALTPEGFVGNNAGGVLGGISTGQDITVSIAIKPTSSIRSPQALDRPCRQPGHGGNLRPPRPLRGHPRHADRRSHAGAGADGPRPAASRPVRRRASRYPEDCGAGAGEVSPRTLLADRALPCRARPDAKAAQAAPSQHPSGRGAPGIPHFPELAVP